MTSLPTFETFFTDLNGHSPFPWQSQLVEQVIRDDAWPESIDVPTGLGKTSLIDVAVYVLATAPPESRAARRRLFFVVDRRLIVDEAYNHAVTISETLASANSDSPLGVIATRLRGKIGKSVARPEPLVVARMRGGTSWDVNWVDRPDQPAIITGTVDQIGSRLFFRGYGTSDFRKPIDAALAGLDSLIVIDEAHLAMPFISSMKDAFALDNPGLPLPTASVVQLSATPTTSETSLTATPFDVEAHLANDEANRRLLASKSIRLAEPVDRKSVVTTLANAVLAALESRPGGRALVVCNTVNRARQVHSEITKRLPKSGLTLAAQDSLLLIGRSRPFDRDGLTPQLMLRFGLGEDRPQGEKIDIAVATQTVEVGANLDVDVLITESAPLNALIQRIGRLNRVGRSTSKPLAIIVHDGVSDDPVYGADRASTWDYLTSILEPAADAIGDVSLMNGTIDGSPLALRKLQQRCPDVLRPEPKLAPAMLPTVLDAWVRTSPIPDPDPALAPYLHGVDEDPKTVFVLWRDALRGVITDEDTNAIMEAMPALAEEMVEVSIGAFRAWMGLGKRTDLADVDFAEVDESSSDTTELEPQLVVIRRGNRWDRVVPRSVRPRDIVVVGAERGGIDQFGWNPDSHAAVADVWEPVRAQRKQPSLAIDINTVTRLASSGFTPGADHSAYVQSFREWNASDNAVDEEIREEAQNETLLRLRQVIGRASDGAVSEHSRLVRGLFRPISDHAVAGTHNVLSPDARLERVTHDLWLLTLRRGRFASSAGNDDSELGSSASRSPVFLSHHHEAVEARARDIAQTLQLPDELIGCLSQAAGMHDLGKLDSRFQESLRVGSGPEGWATPAPLAKSGVDPGSEVARRARRHAKVPSGFRHEAWSARLVALAIQDGLTDARRELVVHLVASHHGRSRPLLPPVADDDPQTLFHQGHEVVTEASASIDWSAPTRFVRLNREFGRWGLAMLETVVRSADQTCSKEGH